MTFQNVSVWINQDKREPAYDASLLGIYDDSGLVSTDKRGNISVCSSRTEDRDQSEGTGS